MLTVDISELKRCLRKYATLAKVGEEIVLTDRNVPVAKLVPFSTQEASQEEQLLVATGRMRLPKSSLKISDLLKIPTGRVTGRTGIQAVLDEREETR